MDYSKCIVFRFSISIMSQDVYKASDPSPIADTVQKFSLHPIGQGRWICNMEDKSYYIRNDDNFCPICHKLFSNCGSMRRHIKSAHGPSTSSKISCDECEATFASKAALSHHNDLSHQKKFKRSDQSVANSSEEMKECQECEKTISSRNFNRHMEEVHNDCKFDTDAVDIPVRPYKCEVCPYTTKRKHDFQRHNKVKHSDVQARYPCEVCGKDFLYEQNMKRHRKCHDK